MKIFIAATRANVGKTTASLGLLSILGKKGGRYGYMKPVGQHSICIDGAYVDSDAVLFKEKFSLHDDIADMNPITIPQGFTEAYIQRPSPMRLGRKSSTRSSAFLATRTYCSLKAPGMRGSDRSSIFQMRISPKSSVSR